MNSLILYRHKLSGHCHRVQLFLSILGLNFNIVEIDLARGDQRTSVFLAKNHFGQVPVLADDDIVVSDSNAILVYLAKKYSPDSNWYPEDPLKVALVQQYLSIAAGPIANGPAAARLVKLFGARIDYVRATEIAGEVLPLIDAELENRQWLVGDEPTIADLANYSYIAHSEEGGINLDAFPHLRNWITNVEGLPGYVPMESTQAAA